MIKALTSYLWYVVRHKWFVLIECFKKHLYWQGIMHDLSKFRPSEFFPYASHFYGRNKRSYFKSNDTKEDPAFDRAWLLHIHRNPHHWQYWILTQDEDEDKILEMSTKYATEMFCDWVGAGKAQGHGNDVAKWYEKHKNKMVLHPNTRRYIRQLLNTLKE